MSKRTDYIDWDTYFLAMVKLNAMRSKDPDTQVGAIIVNDLKHIVSTGYNGLPRGLDDDKYPWSRNGEIENSKYAYVVHAELNAILSSGTSVRDCTLYTSLFPCNECAKSIIQAGIKKIIYSNDKYNETALNKIAKKMFKDAKVETIYKKEVFIEIKY
ncbi:deoxycytidylate deaminase [Spiroplasma litorale]|uniref:Deoxycytidylate deaminase n=1 Tax=Spiroplasma litorale TaxID=216942 RepID=A0A0K1W164_9MOLU|nr:cytidine/deoxycytidylate deaminase family protein [Spiroplasma litorale]AKX33921.1 deoxycytidylate deaminase [Spiroplasma litorale]